MPRTKMLPAIITKMLPAIITKMLPAIITHVTIRTKMTIMTNTTLIQP